MAKKCDHDEIRDRIGSLGELKMKLLKIKAFLDGKIEESGDVTDFVSFLKGLVQENNCGCDPLEDANTWRLEIQDSISNMFPQYVKQFDFLMDKSKFYMDPDCADYWLRILMTEIQMVLEFIEEEKILLHSILNDWLRVSEVRKILGFKNDNGATKLVDSGVLKGIGHCRKRRVDPASVCRYMLKEKIFPAVR